MKIKKLFSFFFTVTIFFPSCHKFPDGLKFSLRSLKNRITGTWKVDKFYVNGEDSTEEFNQLVSCEIEFKKDDYWGNYLTELKSCKNGRILSGNWNYRKYCNPDNEDFGNSYFSLHFNEDTSIYSLRPLIGDTKGYASVFRILRITNKEYNIVHEISYNSYRKTNI
jgi:hypothetical protein